MFLIRETVKIAYCFAKMVLNCFVIYPKTGYDKDQTSLSYATVMRRLRIILSRFSLSWLSSAGFLARED